MFHIHYNIYRIPYHVKRAVVHFAKFVELLANRKADPSGHERITIEYTIVTGGAGNTL